MNQQIVLWTTVLLLGAAGLARAYPPLPQVERSRLTDQQLFEKLNPAHPEMKRVRDTFERQGVEAAKAALAKHFRERQTPRWYIDPHARPKHAARPQGVDTRAADQAMQHVFRGFSFGEEIDWLDNPTYAPGREFDKEWSMAFLRMPWWNDLGNAYWATGDEKYAAEFVRQFLDFTRKHPIPVQRSRGSKHPLKYAVPEWRTLEISIRLSGAWTNAFYRFLSSPSFTDDIVCEMLKSFWEMANHLEQFSSVSELSNNWLTAETSALHVAGILFPEFANAEQWLALAEKRMTEELAKQVYPDGTHWELAPGYGSGVLSQFRKVHELGKLNGRPMPDAYTRRLESMYHYYLYASVDGRMAAFSDSGHGNVRKTLALGAIDYPERLDFLWGATEGREGKVPTELNSVFPYAGHYTMRSGWSADDRFLILDGGPYGSNHQHEDSLNFELWAYGDYLITDPGTYRYNYDSPWRQFMISSLAHNTLMVDHQGQNRRSKRETWVSKQPVANVWLPGEKLTYFRGDYADGYGEGGQVEVTHTRSLFFVDGRYWVLIDRARPRDTAEHLYESLFMLNAEDAVAEGGRILTKREGPNLLLAAAPAPGQTVQVVKGQMEPVRRGWKRGGETVEPNPTAVLAQQGTGPATFIALFYPLAAGENAPVVKIERVPATGGTDAVAALLTFPDGTRRLIVDQLGEGEVTVEGFGPVATPAALTRP